jgi:hypothetical protein
VWGDDEAGGSVDERRSGEGGELREGERPPGHGSRAANDRRRTGRHRAVGAQHHLRVEQREQRVEVTLAGGGQERIGHGPLTAEVGVGNGGSPHIPGMPTLPARLSTL